MSSQRPIEERLSAWFIEDAPGEIPDRVLEATFARTRAARRRPAVLSWRVQPMFSRLAIAATVAAAIALVAINLSGNRPPTELVGGTPSPSAQSSAVPSPLPSGTRTFRTEGWNIHYALPDGWRLDGSSPQDIWLLGPKGGVGMGVLLNAVHANSFFVTDPQLDRNAGTSVDEYVAWLQEHPRIDVTTPVDVTVGGWPAKQLDITLSEGQRYEQGSMPSRLGLAWFGGDTAALGITNGESLRFTLVDLGDATLLISGSSSDMAAHEPDLEAFLGSVYIERAN